MLLNRKGGKLVFTYTDETLFVPCIANYNHHRLYHQLATLHIVTRWLLFTFLCTCRVACSIFCEALNHHPYKLLLLFFNHYKKGCDVNQTRDPPLRCTGGYPMVFLKSHLSFQFQSSYTQNIFCNVSELLYVAEIQQK